MNKQLKRFPGLKPLKQPTSSKHPKPVTSEAVRQGDLVEPTDNRPHSDAIEIEAQEGVLQDCVSSRAQPTVNQGTELVVMEQIHPTVEDRLPTVDGHAVELNEWAAFQTHALTGSVEQAAIAGNVTPWSIWRWKRTGWWKALHSIHVETHQQKFHDRMAARADEIHDAYFSVMRGDEKFGKTANAVIQGAKLFMQSGSDPIIKAKPAIEIQHNTQINSVSVGESITKDWTQDQLNEYARTGKKPERARKKLEAEEN